VKAWAVVCASGKIHEYDNGQTYRLLVYTDAGARGEARKQVGFMNDHITAVPDYRCGPHTVIPLTGTFAPKKGKR
jgi:hypothetical protein